MKSGTSTTRSHEDYSFDILHSLSIAPGDSVVCNLSSLPPEMHAQKSAHPCDELIAAKTMPCTFHGNQRDLHTFPSELPAELN